MNPEYFPHWAANGVTGLGPADDGYNCIAWAAGRADAWWWPDPDGVAFWPDGVDRAETVEAFAAAFRILGYEPCPDGDPEPGVEKFALSAAAGVPTHAARSHSGGGWTSKLGRGPLVAHPTPHGVEGPVYGTVCVYFGRPV